MPAGLLRNIFVLSVLALAASGTSAGAASASVSFTEIMFNAPGSDEGREWVEVYNSSSTAVDFAGWRFSEGGVNHKLIFSESSLLAPGAFAVIADDAETFRAEYPSFSGPLFDSSFSLSNAVETLSLLNASSTAVASVTYRASGGTGDGNTLNAVGEAWVPRAPSPGAPASEYAITPPPKPLQPKAAGNSARESAVRTESAAPAGAAGEPALAQSASVGSSSFSRMLPWIFGLLAVVAAGIGAVFLMPKKKPEDEYEITEERP